MRWDESKLEEDGDPYERLWWRFLEEEFPEWERFWAHHAVPLTKRIEAKVKRKNRMYFRDDPDIHKGVEELLMANYSVFYYLARSCVIVAAEPHLFPEDGFFFLQAALENTKRFLDAFATRLAPTLGISEDDVPQYARIEQTELAQQIEMYRNTFAHYPRLGRSPHLGWEFIPKPSHVGKAKLSWHHAQNLPVGEFVDSRKHLKKYQTDLMKMLNPAWMKITSLLDERRTSPEYLAMYRLREESPGVYQPINTQSDVVMKGPGPSAPGKTAH
jgi:hypothetical protein